MANFCIRAARVLAPSRGAEGVWWKQHDRRIRGGASVSNPTPLNPVDMSAYIVAASRTAAVSFSALTRPPTVIIFML
jgi:hypothetical protein